MGQDGYPTSVSEATEAVRAVVTEVLDRATGDLDADWAALAAAGLLALPVPQEHGGEGLGLVEVAVLLREAGARGVRLPVWETLCCSALTLAAHGTDAQGAELLPGVADGGRLLSPAVREVGHGIPEAPSTTVADDGNGVRVTGRKIAVTYAERASRLLVTATRAGTAVVALVDPAGPGVTLLPSGSSSGEPTHTVVLDDAPADLLDGGVGDGRAARLLRELAVAGLCVSAAGVVAGARDLTASYVKGREQFGRQLAEFQAVAQQVADVYIASRTLDLAATNAALAGRRGPRRDRRPRGGGVLVRRRRARPRCTPATTCTAAWGSTRPTRCTATSPGSPTSPTPLDASAADVPRRGPRSPRTSS